jgi:hypothetical protein
MMDVDQASKAMKDAEIEDFIEDFNQPACRDMRVNGGAGSSQDGWSGL